MMQIYFNFDINLKKSCILCSTNKAEGCVEHREAIVVMSYIDRETTYSNQLDGAFTVSYEGREGNWILNRNWR